MKYFKLFEQFAQNLKSVNEAKIDYSLKDLMSDAPSKEYSKMCDFIASTIGEDPKNIAVITSEDDNFGDYEEKFRNSKFTPMNNPSAETSTFYSKDSNVVMSNDGSAVSYFVSAKDMV
jgi:hypothetical protein